MKNWKQVQPIDDFVAWGGGEKEAENFCCVLKIPNSKNDIKFQLKYFMKWRISQISHEQTYRFRWNLEWGENFKLQFAQVINSISQVLCILEYLRIFEQEQDEDKVKKKKK